MKIYRYDQASLTGYVMVPVPDDYELQKGELKELPYPCYTPMKLDSAGNLISATIEESNQAAQEFIKSQESQIQEISMQQQIALLSTQFAMQVQAQNKANALMLSEIAQLKIQTPTVASETTAETAKTTVASSSEPASTVKPSTTVATSTTSGTATANSEANTETTNKEA